MLLKAEDEIEHKEKKKHLLERCETDCPTICNYLTSRLLPLMKEKVWNMRHIVSMEWSNNYAESMNHVLKQKADWKSQRIAELITLIETNVKLQYKDVERAMVKLEPFHLASAFTKFEISYHDWSQKNENERKRNLEDFMNHFPKTKTDSISTNAKLIMKTMFHQHNCKRHH